MCFEDITNDLSPAELPPAFLATDTHLLTIIILMCIFPFYLSINTLFVVPTFHTILVITVVCYLLSPRLVFSADVFHELLLDI